MKLNQVSEKKRQKLTQQIINDYTEAVSYGNTDALYQLGRQKFMEFFIVQMVIPPLVRQLI